MKVGQSSAHILPLRRGKPMNVPSLSEFPEEVQEIIYEILANALIRNEEREEAS